MGTVPMVLVVFPGVWLVLLFTGCAGDILTSYVTVCAGS